MSYKKKKNHFPSALEEFIGFLGVLFGFMISITFYCMLIGLEMDLGDGITIKFVFNWEWFLRTGGLYWWLFKKGKDNDGDDNDRGGDSSSGDWTGL